MRTKVEAVLQEIPRAGTYRQGLATGALANVYLDNSGNLCIIGQFGALQLKEKDLDSLLAEDIFPDIE